MASSEWCAAMASEFNALMQQATWDLVPKNTVSNLIGCKWVFRVKRRPDGSIDRYKARLVAKGFHQRPGLDYDQIFSPVIKPSTARLVLTLAIQKRWHIHQLDVNNAFLHGKLSETVYMQQPPGFHHPNYPNHVCRLKKYLYGPKQAPRAWFNTLHSFLLSYGFVNFKSDPSLFIYLKGDVKLYTLVYVDDILITGNNNHAIAKCISTLATMYSVMP